MTSSYAVEVNLSIADSESMRSAMTASHSLGLRFEVTMVAACRPKLQLVHRSRRRGDVHRRQREIADGE